MFSKTEVLFSPIGDTNNGNNSQQGSSEQTPDLSTHQKRIEHFSSSWSRVATGNSTLTDQQLKQQDMWYLRNYSELQGYIDSYNRRAPVLLEEATTKVSLYDLELKYQGQILNRIGELRKDLANTEEFLAKEGSTLIGNSYFPSVTNLKENYHPEFIGLSYSNAAVSGISASTSNTLDNTTSSDAAISGDNTNAPSQSSNPPVQQRSNVDDYGTRDSSQPSSIYELTGGEDGD